MFFLFALAIVSAVFGAQGSTGQYSNGHESRVYVYRIPSSSYSPSQSRRSYYPVVIDDERMTLASTASGRYVPRSAAQKVILDVYYETDCPDSMRFITTQLYPLYQEMEDVVDIRLVPYGKARESYNAISNKYDFLCHHGTSECYGNTVQSCAISLYPEPKDHLSFINCMEMYPRPSHSGTKCARRLSLNWSKIEKCVSSDEGNRLMHENAQRTENLSPSLYFVPWIVVDRVFSSSNQRTAQRDLKSVVCKAYRGSHPKCK